MLQPKLRLSVEKLFRRKAESLHQMCLSDLKGLISEIIRSVRRVSTIIVSCQYHYLHEVDYYRGCAVGPHQMSQTFDH